MKRKQLSIDWWLTATTQELAAAGFATNSTSLRTGAHTPTAKLVTIVAARLGVEPLDLFEAVADRARRRLAEERSRLVARATA